VTATTIFPIASVTKQFTAAAIMQLVERHKLRLSDQLATLLPNVRWMDRRANSVTVRQLLTHTSGIPGYTSVPGFDRLESRPQNPTIILKLVTRLPLKFAPGTQAAYSNTGYYLLGLIIERVTGLRYDDYVRQQLLVPLDMSDTGPCPQVADRRQARLYTTGGRSPNAAPPISLANAYSAGDLCSTAADLLRWQQALTSGRVVSSASYREMVTPLRLLDGHRIAYGFGLDLDPIDGHAAVSHEGGFPGATSDLTWYPHNGLAIAVLSNSSAIAAWDLSAQIAARLLP
jgi:CubicO group peptidase (beta-lactamase class C family)